MRRVTKVENTLSDTPLIDHMREFLSGLPSFRSMHFFFSFSVSPNYGRVREQFADSEQSSLRNLNDIFFGLFSSKIQVFEEDYRLLIEHHMHMLRVYCHRC